MGFDLLPAGLAIVVLQASAAAAQPVVDFRNLKAQEVRSAVFTVAAPQEFRVEAIGAESARDAGTFSWVTAMWRGNDSNRVEPWMGNAWILDTRSRRVVWELSTATTSRGSRSTRVFNGTVRLPAGSYEAFYSSFPDVWVGDGESGTGRRLVGWLTDQGFDQFRLTIQGQAQVLAEADADRSRRDLEAGAIVALRGSRSDRYVETGFILDRRTEVEIYATGEARQDADFDAGWIIDADTRAAVWRLSWRESAPAGGAVKNRMARVTKTLPAGRYAAMYATDDSHDPSEWNAAPPRDPHAWGLFVRVSDPAARAAVKTFTYDHVPASAVIAALTKVGDDETLTKRFTVTSAADVRVYAIGEGSDNRMFDYGWITNAATGAKVWEMSFGQTESAGGATKNRLVDRTIRLEKGDYVLHYVSDDSHAYDRWNAAAPRDTARWGISVLRTVNSR